MEKKYDFAGWATRNDLKCTDGRTIRHDAFKECDGKIVPLVWNHQHNDSDNVLGHAELKIDQMVYIHMVISMIPKRDRMLNFLFNMAILQDSQFMPIN